MLKKSSSTLLCTLAIQAGAALGIQQGPQAALDRPTNLGFEEGPAGSIPAGWFVPEATKSGFEVSVIENGAREGAHCVQLERSGSDEAVPIGNLMQRVNAEAYRGKRLRLKAAVRTEMDGDGRVQFWVRVDRPDRVMGFFDNMSDRPIRSSRWTRCEFLVDVHPDAEKLNFGLMVFGSGKAWLDDVTLELAGEADPDYVAMGICNADFEDGASGGRTQCWTVPTAGYEASLSSDRPKSGKLCARIASQQGLSGEQTFGTMMQSIDATPYRGQRVRLKAAVRADVSGANGAQLWLRVDRPNEVKGFFENMADRPIRDSEWKSYEIVGDVDPDATTLNFGLILKREGSAWWDDVTLERVAR